MCDNMVKEIKMSAEEAIEYVRENVQIRDILEISSNAACCFLDNSKELTALVFLA